MNEEITQGEQFCQQYREEILKLTRYLPWLSSVSGNDVSKAYDGSLGKSDISFPVFDSTLLNFVKELQKTQFMDKNYPYAYTRRHIKTPEDEIKYIDKAWLNDIDYLKAVLTKYTTEGMRKAGRWSEAVDRGLYTRVIEKLYEILMYYTSDKKTTNQ